MFHPRGRRAPNAADIVLFVVLAACIPLLHRAGAETPASDRLEITASGMTRDVALGQDADHRFDGPRGVTRVRVRGRTAWIDSTSCPDRLCARMGRLHGPGRALVCLPNRLVVRIPGRDPSVDAIAR